MKLITYAKELRYEAALFHLVQNINKIHKVLLYISTFT